MQSYHSQLSFKEKKSAIYRFQCRCTKELLKLLDELGQSIVQKLGRVSISAALALAGPIQEGGNIVEITNYTGEKRLLKSDLPHHLFHTSYFLNDLESCCFGILNVGLQGKLGEYFIDAFAPTKDKSVKKQIEFNHMNYAILAMGTGLGTGILLFRDGEFRVFPLEAGHCKATFPGRASQEREKDVSRLEYLSKKIYNSKFSIEFEDICSGRGLESCYEFEMSKEKDFKPLASKEISQESMTGNKHAEEAMMAHYRYLMKAAQNITVMTVCKGVFFAGDNQVNNEPFFNSHCQQLQEEFHGHVKSDWLKNMVSYRQVETCNFNLQGAFYYQTTKKSKL
jgi:glucokinase